jgi:ribonucleoside-triphosphate reductase
MYPFLIDGLTKLGGLSKAPTDLKSYCGEFINLVYSISSQFMGAVATPEFLMYMDYFIRKDYGDNYLTKLGDVVEINRKSRTLEKVIENCFQQVVHSMNMPAGNRGYQTVFWNVSYFDQKYFEGVFGDFVFPDGTKPVWETLSWLQKKFQKWLNHERSEYAVITFPVETVALMTDGKDGFLDEEPDEEIICEIIKELLADNEQAE